MLCSPMTQTSLLMVEEIPWSKSRQEPCGSNMEIEKIARGAVSLQLSMRRERAGLELSHPLLSFESTFQSQGWWVRVGRWGWVVMAVHVKVDGA